MRSRPRNSFPDDFFFGVATADHQCEAYNGADDIRDVWERENGQTLRGYATNFWERYRQDVDLAKGLGCTAFRLSLSWARLEPEPNTWDQSTFDHYQDLLAYIRSLKMRTVVTLHHNTWPLHVQAEEGGAGMLASSFPLRFANYAEQAAMRLGDLIDYWLTLNEPNQLIFGYIELGRSFPMPPGLEDASDSGQAEAVLRAIPNLFRANKAAFEAIKRRRPNARVGTNPLILGLPSWAISVAELFLKHATPQAVKRRVRRISQRHRSASSPGDVDISIAQLVPTQARMSQVLFSEAYFLAHPSLLHNATKVPPSAPLDFAGRIAVPLDVAGADSARAIFPISLIQEYDDMSAALRALQRGGDDFIFGENVVLQPYVTGSLTLSRLQSPDQPFAVAMAPGARTLLDVVDTAIGKFKESSDEQSAWERAAQAHNLDSADPGPVLRRRVLTSNGAVPLRSQQGDDSLQRIRERGKLRVGVRSGVPGLCEVDVHQNYTGLEPDIAEFIGQSIFGEPGHVQFVEVSGQRRLDATRSWFGLTVEPFLRLFSTLFTLAATDWWSLGLAGKLPCFLCPSDCVGKLDYVGTDYYWGTPKLLSVQNIEGLVAAIKCHYSQAPVWPGNIPGLLRRYQRLFPNKRIIIIENGCVPKADGYTRARYLEAHLAEVARAVNAGSPVDGYLCWSITSNREWGLPFNGNSDFGLYHIDLDFDPDLRRTPTDAARTYAEIIAGRSV